MSRVFDASLLGASETYIVAPASAVYNNLPAITIATWVLPSVDGFGYQIVKDPAATGVPLLVRQNDNTFQANFGGRSVTYGTINTWEIADGGVGYASGDTGTILDGDLNSTTYQVNTVDGITGAITGMFLVDSPSVNVTLGTKTSTTGGDQPGLGVGLTITVTGINGNNATARSVETIPTGVWSHIAATWGTSGTFVKLYINGVECTYTAERPRSEVAPTTDDGGGFWFGNDGFDDGMTGDLAEPVIYSAVLSGVEVATLAASTTGATGAPVGYWHFCGDASPEPDETVNGNDGVLSANPPTAGPDSPGYTCAGGATSILSVIVNVGAQVDRNSDFSVLVNLDAPCVADTVVDLTLTGNGNLSGVTTGTFLSGKDGLNYPGLQIDLAGVGDVITATQISGDPVGTKDSDPFDVIDTAVATINTIGAGAFGGNALALAFFNPHHLDLMQVINEGGKIVWNLTYDGVATVDPTNATAKSLLARYEGASFVQAFYNPYSKDILQVVGPGDIIHFWVDATGTAHFA